MDFLAEIKRFHTKVIQPLTGQPVGCSKREVETLENQIGFALPEAYRQYLLWMGKDYQGAFVGSDWFITDVIENTKYLPELLADNSSEFDLADHYLAFFGHQGYIIAWFNLPKESENPTVYFFSECEAATTPRIEGNFTDVLFKDLRTSASVRPEVKSLRT